LSDHNDPFSKIEFYAFRATLLILFLHGLYQVLKATFK
jgi:hypothetical protein